MLLVFIIVLAGLFTAAQPTPSNPPLLIGAYNVKTFGKTKMGKPEIAKVLAKVVTRYDIMLLQEIRDISETAIVQLLNQVKLLNPNYKFVMSERLGRSTYKEQYAYFYRTDTVDLMDTLQYDDGPDDGTDLFSREPYCILARATGGVQNMTLCGIHMPPNDVVAEADGLITVHEKVVEILGTKNVMFHGDFNADGRYLSKTKLESLLMYKDKSYFWVIDSDEDTMVKASSDNAYDRIVVTGTKFIAAIFPDSVMAYTGYEDEFNLDEDQSYAVSDHYPVEVKIQFN